MRVSRIELTVKMFGVERTCELEIPSRPDLSDDDIAWLEREVSSQVERRMKEDIEKQVLHGIYGTT